MILGIIITIIILLGSALDIGLKELVEDIKESAGVYLVTAFLINGMCFIIAFVVGLTLDGVDHLHIGELTETHNLVQLSNGNEQLIGLSNRGNSVIYLYAIEADKGKQLREGRGSHTYINEIEDGEPTAETYKNEFKNELLKLLIPNHRMGYTILNLPKGYELDWKDNTSISGGFINEN